MNKTTGNPFTLDFGREPYEMIPRSLLMDDIFRSFTDEHPSVHVNIITGVRGSGKTVLMTVSERELESGFPEISKRYGLFEE